MSLLAKAVLGFQERGVTIHYDGFVQVPEAVFEKWTELARKEVKLAAAAVPARPSRPPMPGGSR